MCTGVRLCVVCIMYVLYDMCMCVGLYAVCAHGICVHMYCGQCVFVCATGSVLCGKCVCHHRLHGCSGKPSSPQGTPACPAPRPGSRHKAMVLAVASRVCQEPVPGAGSPPLRVAVGLAQSEVPAQEPPWRPWSRAKRFSEEAVTVAFPGAAYVPEEHPGVAWDRALACTWSSRGCSQQTHIPVRSRGLMPSGNRWLGSRRPHSSALIARSPLRALWLCGCSRPRKGEGGDC